MINAAKNMKKQPKKTVKIMGNEVTVGTKEHARLVEQKRLFDQNDNRFMALVINV